MSDVNLNFVVDTNPVELVISTNELAFQPQATNLTFSTVTDTSDTPPGGTFGQIQFNDSGAFGGTPNLTYSSGLLSLTANVSNVKITGGTNGYVLQTDGAGNLSWTAQTGGSTGNGVPGGANTQVQYNDAGSFGGDGTFTFNEVTKTLTVQNLNVANGFSNGTANIRIYNSAEIALSSYTDANLLVLGRDSGTPAVFVNGELNSFNQSWYNLGPNALVQVGNVEIRPDTVDITGNLTAGNANLGNLTISNYFSGDGSLLSNINGANITGGSVPLAQVVTDNAQPNITSVGTLTSLTVSGNLSAGNASLGNLTVSNYFSGNGSLLTNINGGNVTGTVPTAGTVTTGAQPNITSVGTLFGLTLSPTSTASMGNITANNISSNTVTVAGNLRTSGNSIVLGYTTNASAYGVAIGSNAIANGANGVSIGRGAGPDHVTNDAIYIGTNSGGNGTGQANSIAIGHFSGATAQGVNSITIGRNAGNLIGQDAIAIGNATGKSQGIGSIAIGSNAAITSQGVSAIAIGSDASKTQGLRSIAIGANSAEFNQSTYAISIGSGAGRYNQGDGSIAIGDAAANNGQSTNCIAIGRLAGDDLQHANTVILNATGSALNSTQSNSLFVKPIRDVTGESGFTVQLYYNPTTGEIGYK